MASESAWSCNIATAALWPPGKCLMARWSLFNLTLFLVFLSNPNKRTAKPPTFPRFERDSPVWAMFRFHPESLSCMPHHSSNQTFVVSPIWRVYNSWTSDGTTCYLGNSLPWHGNPQNPLGIAGISALPPLEHPFQATPIAKLRLRPQRQQQGLFGLASAMGW